MKKTLVFDTETTGVPKKGSSYKDNDYPRLLQLAWILVDKDFNIVDKRNNFIIPNGFEVPKTEFHISNGLTQEVCENGKDVKEELNVFLDAIDKSDSLLAHNMMYDFFILASELHKNKIDKKVKRKPKFCTMLSTIDYCRIPSAYQRGGFKFPKLEELHMKLFGESFDNAHDAYSDVMATLRCYKRMNELGIPLLEVLKK